MLHDHTLHRPLALVSATCGSRGLYDGPSHRFKEVETDPLECWLETWLKEWLSWFILTCLFLLKYFAWHSSYERGREEEGRRATLIFLRASLSVPGGYFSPCRLCFPSHLWASVAKIAVNTESGWVPWHGIFFLKFHTSLTACCSHGTVQPITPREREAWARLPFGLQRSPWNPPIHFLLIKG